MKLAMTSVAVLALAISASIASAQQPGYPVIPVTPTAPPVVVVSVPPVVVAPPPVVVVPQPVYPAYGVTVVRPGIGVNIGIGGVVPAYPRPYYGRPAYYYGHHHYYHR